MTSVNTNSDFAYLDRAFAGDHSYRPAPAVAEAANGGDKPSPTKEASLFGEDGFGFDDFLDIINPLQHIPLISNLYREFTGDELSPGARMIGGGIFGGGIGLASSMINSAIEMETGRDIGGHVIAMFKGDEAAEDSNVAKAPAPAAPTTQTTPTEQAAPIVAPQATATVQQAALSAQPQPANLTDQGLQLKTAMPKLHQKIQEVHQQNGQSLTDDQMARILGSFKLGKPAAPVAAPVSAPASIQPVSAPVVNTQPAPATVEAPATRTTPPAQGRIISDNYSYLDSLV